MTKKPKPMIAAIPAMSPDSGPKAPSVSRRKEFAGQASATTMPMHTMRVMRAAIMPRFSAGVTFWVSSASCPSGTSSSVSSSCSPRLLRRSSVTRVIASATANIDTKLK